MQEFTNEPAPGCAADASENLTSAKDEAVGTIQEAVNKSARLGQRSRVRFDAQREPAANALDNTAATLHEQGDRVARATGNAAHATADRIQCVADYVRDNDSTAMLNDVAYLMRRYPAQFLAAGLAVGFLIARSLRSRG